MSCNGTRKMFCPDECENAQCFSYPKATCRMNDCYYCKKEFVDENDQVVDCDKDIGKYTSWPVRAGRKEQGSSVSLRVLSY